MRSGRAGILGVAHGNAVGLCRQAGQPLSLGADKALFDGDVVGRVSDRPLEAGDDDFDRRDALGGAKGGKLNDVIHVSPEYVMSLVTGPRRG